MNRSEPYDYDVAIVGAGPAGMSAAIECAKHELSVIVLDEQAAPGGQIYRGVGKADTTRAQVLGRDYAAGRGLTREFEESGVVYKPQAAVWNLTRSKELHILKNHRVESIRARHVVLATGALERPFPIPGWTLPGVMAAGAAQILLKSAGAVPNGPTVLVGCGPLLYLLAWQYVQAGIPISAIIETATEGGVQRASRHWMGALTNLPTIKKGLEMIRAIRRSGIALYRDVTDLRAEGDERVTHLRFVDGGITRLLPVNVLLLHQGVVPNTQFTWALRAEHHWSQAQLCWMPCVTEDQELIDVSDIFVAGDGAAIVGAHVAALQGTRIGLVIAVREGRLPASAQASLLGVVDRKIRRLSRVRPFLDELYRPRREHRVPADAVIVCRCEEVTAGTLREHIRLGCQGPSQLKAFGRCGMGPCQGRECGLTVTELIASERAVPPSEVGYFRIRPPIKQITLGELMQE